MSRILVILYLELVMSLSAFSQSIDIRFIYNKWILVHTEQLKENSLKGYWEFYGMDVLDISEDQIISTYSLSSPNPISVSSFAVDLDNNLLSIFRDNESLNELSRDSNITLKLVGLNAENMIIRYAWSSTNAQVNNEILELHYEKIKEYDLSVALESVEKMLTQTSLKADGNDGKEAVYFSFKKSKKGEDAKGFVVDDGKTKGFGVWMLLQVGKSILLTLQKDDDNKFNVYQIKEIHNEYLSVVRYEKDGVIESQWFMSK